jgi:hypothetical protein
MCMLCSDSIEYHLAPTKSNGSIENWIRSAKGSITNLLNDTGPYEEHAEYLRYGVLDLIYKLTFRIRKRSRAACFAEYVKIICAILERSASPSGVLRTKATDLWNRILSLGEKDGLGYGKEEDREAIHCWINKRPYEVELSDCSET